MHQLGVGGDDLHDPMTPWKDYETQAQTYTCMQPCQRCFFPLDLFGMRQLLASDCCQGDSTPAVGLSIGHDAPVVSLKDLLDDPSQAHKTGRMRRKWKWVKTSAGEWPAATRSHSYTCNQTHVVRHNTNTHIYHTSHITHKYHVSHTHTSPASHTSHTQ